MKQSKKRCNNYLDGVESFKVNVYSNEIIRSKKVNKK